MLQFESQCTTQKCDWITEKPEKTQDMFHICWADKFKTLQNVGSLTLFQVQDE